MAFAAHEAGSCGTVQWHRALPFPLLSRCHRSRPRQAAHRIRNNTAPKPAAEGPQITLVTNQTLNQGVRLPGNTIRAR
jgi:hypothetical protein